MFNGLLEELLQKAKKEAVKRSHQSISIEHFCVALFDEESVKAFFERISVNTLELQSRFVNYLENQERNLSHVKDLNPNYHLQKVLQKSIFYSLSLGKNEVDYEDFLVATLEEESYASYVFKQAGINKYFLESVSKKLDYNHESNKDSYGNSYLSMFALDLNEYVKNNSFCDILERDSELNRALLILSKKNKSNPLLVGDEGVGKTSLVYALAHKIINKDVPKNLLTTRLFLLDLASLLAGTKYRGDFENRLKLILNEVKENKDIIIVIDEIHMLIGAGISFNSSLDAANILKPALSDGTLRCIGMTTFKEYRNYFEKDKALSRRFQKIDILEPSIESCFKILQSIKSQYELFHDITIPNDVIAKIIELSDRYLHEKKFPDKAIDVLDESCALIKQSSDKTLTKSAVEKTISAMINMPNLDLSNNNIDLLKNLNNLLNQDIFGQEEAINNITQAILLSRSGLKDKNKPIANFLFTGPTGVGKTEIANVLAKILNVKLIRFDMSEYMEAHNISKLIGAPPGYLGHERGGLLTEAISQNPYSILLLDEIEKAHQDIFNILLQVMDYGKLTDNLGRYVDFRSVILIITSNSSNTVDNNSSIKQLFSLEFRNRLDKVVLFNSLNKEILLKIVNKNLQDLQQNLLEKNIYLTISDKAKEYLVEHGYEPSMGARPLKRMIDKLIKNPLSYKILFEHISGKLEAFIDIKNNTLTIDYQST